MSYPELKNFTVGTTPANKGLSELTNLTRVELGKFDPPLWHAPYGRIV